MKPVIVHPCSFADLEAAPNFAQLLAEYATESAIDGLGQPSAQFETYRRLDEIGAIQVLGAFQESQLIGFLIMAVAELPHYGVRTATSESFFVAGAARKTGAGLKLLHCAEDVAKQRGAIGFFISAPLASRLEKVLPGVGYRETNRVFFRSLA